MTVTRREFSVHCRLHEQADSALEALVAARFIASERGRD